MHPISAQTKREIGYWAEETVDTWMAGWGFRPGVKNKKIPGGEIDRIYVRYVKGRGTQICLSEIKMTTISSIKEFPFVFSEIGMRRFIRPRQISNLVRTANRISGQQHVWIRLFIVVKFACGDGDESVELPFGSPKICHRNSSFWIFSLEPDLIQQNRTSGNLQVGIP